MTPDLATTRSWLTTGTELFLATVASLRDDDLEAPTTLPDWTRRHLVAHVHLNAEALRRLAYWARTGEHTPMYASAEQRAADIAEYAMRPATELRALVRTSADALAADLDTLEGDAWQREVQTAQGRALPATKIPWLRVREVVVHAIDLDTGVTFADQPQDLVRALVDDTIGGRFGQGHGPDIAAWLTGRGNPPQLQPWL